MDQLLFLLTKRQEEHALKPSSPEVIKFDVQDVKKSPDRKHSLISHIPKLQQARKSSPNSSISHTKPKKKLGSYQYESPFIAAARRKAADRAKQSQTSLLSRRDSQSSLNEWNNDTKTLGLFDPKLKKTEIFKPMPHRYRSESQSTPTRSSYKNEEVKSSPLKSNNSKSITLRTDKDVPLYKPKVNNASNSPHFSIDKTSTNMRYSSNPYHTTKRMTPSSEVNTSIDRELDSDRDDEAVYVEVKSRSTSPFDERLVELLIDDHVVERDEARDMIDHINHHSSPHIQSPSRSVFHPPINHHYQHPILPPSVPDHQPTVDIMNSMAKLMDAVGVMVTRAADTVTSAKISQRQRSSYRTLSENHKGSSNILTRHDIENQVQTQFLQVHHDRTTTNQVGEHISNSPPMAHQSLAIEPSTRQRQVPRIDAHSPVYAQQRGRPSNQIDSKNRRVTKSSMMDLILTKLQAIDKSEREIQAVISREKEADDHINIKISIKPQHHTTNRTSEHHVDNIHMLRQPDDACRLPSGNVSSTQRNHHQATVKSTTDQDFYYHAPLIVYTHDTALRSGVDSIFDINNKANQLDYDSHHNHYNHPMSTKIDPLSFSHPPPSSLHTSQPHLQQHQQSPSSHGLSPELRVLLDPARGDYSRRHDDRRAIEYERQKVIRDGVEHLPVLQPLHYDVALDLKQYQKSMDRVRQLKHVAFHERGANFNDLVTRMGDHIFDQVVNEVEGEIEGFIGEYANHFAGEI